MSLKTSQKVERFLTFLMVEVKMDGSRYGIQTGLVFMILPQSPCVGTTGEFMT